MLWTVKAGFCCFRIMKRLKFLIILITVIAVCVMSVSADIGNSFNDDWGDDFDYDDYDYDYDDYDFDYADYDDDFDYGDTYVDFNADDGVSVILGAVIAVLVLIVIYRKEKFGNQQTNRRMARNAPNLYGESIIDEESVIAKITETDPDFSAADFKAFAEQCYLQLTEAWEGRDWSIARQFESDTLFNIHKRQLDEYIEQKKTNHMDAQCVLSKVLTGFRSDGKTDTVVVKLNATGLDYVTDDTTGAILSGSKTNRYNRFYRMEFIRSTGTKTPTHQGLTAHQCPSCGAPLALTAAGKCEYCGNVVTSGAYTWVLNAYGRWN